MAKPPKQISHEELVKYEQQQIGKEFSRKRMILKYQKIIMISGIILIVFVVATVGIYAVYKIFQKPSLPEQANQAVEAPPADFTIKANQINILPQENNKYNALVLIQNTDQNWGVPRLAYTILLKDANKNIVAEKQGSTYILPNQQKSLIELGIESQDPAVSASVDFETKEVQKLTESPVMDFPIENVAYQVVDKKSKISGTISNQTPFGFNEILINVLVYEGNDALKGVNYTTINTLTPGQKRDFTVFWRSNLNVKKPRIVLEPYVNPFNSTPFLDIYSEGQMLQY